eukprot:4787429-Amphidinium_carterae.5
MASGPSFGEAIKTQQREDSQAEPYHKVLSVLDGPFQAREGQREVAAESECRIEGSSLKWAHGERHTAQASVPESPASIGPELSAKHFGDWLCLHVSNGVLQLLGIEAVLCGLVASVSAGSNASH